MTDARRYLRLDGSLIPSSHSTESVRLCDSPHGRDAATLAFRSLKETHCLVLTCFQYLLIFFLDFTVDSATATMGVPFGLSISDLTSAIKLAKTIYEKCFDQAQDAGKWIFRWHKLDVVLRQRQIMIGAKYRQFVDDIRILGQCLERLGDVVQIYEMRYPRRSWHHHRPGFENGEKLWPQLTGDFHQTLQECDAFLSRHGYLRGGRSRVSRNFRFFVSSAENSMENLTAKLRFHIDKVEFYTRPSEFDAVMRNGFEIENLRAQVASLEDFVRNGPRRSQTSRAEILSDESRNRFETAFSTNPTSWYQPGSEWPLKEAFEALTFHFAAGTVSFNSSSAVNKTPELSQYLELAKSVWIVEKIKETTQFQNAGPESIWARRMRQLEDDLNGQMHRFETGELEKPSDQQMYNAIPDCWLVKSGNEEPPDPFCADEAGPQEEKILEVQLPSDAENRESALLVFREDDANFRLVTSTKQADMLVAQYDRELDVNTERNRLVPAYGNPHQGILPRYNLLLYDERGRRPKEFVCQSREDVHKLQRALTGYRVHHDMPLARFCINSSSKAEDRGGGLLQLWQFKPLPAMTGKLSNTSDVASSLGGSGPSGRGVQWPTTAPASPNLSEQIRLISGSSTSPTLEDLGWTQQEGSFWPQATRNLSCGGTDHRFSGTTKRDSQPPTAETFGGARKSIHDSLELRKLSSARSITTSHNTVTSAVRGPRNDGTEVSKPVLPALVVFATDNGKYNFLHLTCRTSTLIPRHQLTYR